MSRTTTPKDLVVLVADKCMDATVDSLLRRHEALSIRPLEFESIPHPRKDAGCRKGAADFLRPFTKRFQHALVLFDREGSGREDQPPEEIERTVEEAMSSAGWDHDRAKTIVLDPELEIWVWSDSTEVDRICGWSSREPSLREWLLAEGWITGAGVKPTRPKEALERALRLVRKQFSSALFRELARTVSLRRCRDRAFLKLRETLADWFPPPGASES